MLHRAPIRLLLSLTMTGALATPLLATDGVIEINQAAILAASGFPYPINAPGSYRLTSNLTVTAGSAQAIFVSADDVTIDLNGFTIRGPGTGNADGIFSSSTGLTVRNGTITDFGRNGILAGPLRAEDLTVSSNGTNGIDCQSGQIVDVVAENNQIDGVVIAAGLVRGCLIRGNIASGLNGSASGGGPSKVGYHHNVFDLNGDANVKAGVNLGNNLCGTTQCP